MNEIVVSDTWVGTPGGRLFARRWEPALASTGHPAPVILLHDSLGSVDLWRGFPEALARQAGRTVIAYDRLGFGRSDRRQGAMPFGFVGEEAELALPFLLDAFGIGRFAAFGHSIGAGMAVHCAAHFGERCTALVVESAQAYIGEETLAGIRQAREAFRQQEQFARLERFHGEKARWVLGAWIDTWLSPQFAHWSLEAVLPLVRCPALVIHGGEDDFGSRRHPETIARLAGGPVELEIMEGVRHVPHRECEQQVMGMVTGFLAHCA